MAKKPKKKKEDKIISELRGDLGAGRDFYKEFFPSDPLGHYQDPRAVEEQNLLNLRNSYASPLTAMYSPEELAAHYATLDSQVGVNGVSGEQVNAEKQRLKGLTKNNEAFAGRHSADIMDIINRFRSGLDGYTAAENTGFRESAERGLDSTLATQLYNTQRDQARSGVRGAAANAQAVGMRNERQRQGRELDQEIFIKNADEKQDRLKTYADFQRTADADAFDRGQQAIQNYETTLGNARNSAFEIGKFNIGQDEKTQSRDVGTQLGLTGLIGTRRSAKRQDKIIGG